MSAQEITSANDFFPSREKALFAIQVSAFSQKPNASALMLNLKERGYEAYIVEEKDHKELVLYKVRIGKYETAAEAKTEAWSFSTREKISCLVVGKDTSASGFERGERVQKASAAQKIEIVPELPAAEQKTPHDPVMQTPASALIPAVSNAPENKPEKAGQDKHAALTFFEGLPFKIYAAVDPRFAYMLYYEDNVYGTIDNKEADFSNRYQPSASLSIKSDRLSIEATTSIEIIEYCRERGYNTVNQEHGVNFALITGQRSTGGLGYNYSVNTDPNRYFITEEGGSGSPALEGKYTVKKYKTKTNAYPFTHTYKLSPQSSLESIFMYSTFDTGGSDSSDFYNAMLNYTYALSSTTNLKIGLTFNKFDFTISGSGDTQFIEDIITGGYYNVPLGSAYKMKNYSFSGALSHKFGKDVNFSLAFGGNYKKNDVSYDTIDPDTAAASSYNRKTDGDGINYSFKLEKTLSNTIIYFDAMQGSGTIPDTGASYVTRNINVRVTHNFTKKIQGAFHVTYNPYEADEGDYGSKIDRNILLLRQSITYNYARWLDVALSYNYSKDKNKISNWEITRNTLYLSFNFKPLRPYIFR